jgi:adenosylcobinamide-phosphate guanylyltransferase
MIGIIMAGGRGSRMNLSEEKLLLKYKKPMILHVADALKDSNCFSKIIFITSPNSPKTKKLLLENKFEIVDSPGMDYVSDLNTILKSYDESVFIISGDLPLIDSKIVQDMIKFYDPKNICTTILVTKKFHESLGLSSSYDVVFRNQSCVYTGISMINPKNISNLENIEESFVILDDKRIGFNVNTKNDFDLLCAT